MKSEHITVFKGNPIQCEMIKQMLEENGIISNLKNQMMGSIAPWLVSYGGNNPVIVEVIYSDEVRATELITEFTSAIED